MSTIRILMSAICLFISITVFSQLDTIKKEVKKHFNTQGEQEEYWGQQSFERQEKNLHFERYQGKISVLNENVIKYDDVVLNIYNISPDLKEIFKKGIFYPGIIAGDQSGKILNKQQNSDSLSKGVSSFLSSDTLTIGYLKELESLSSSPKIKRFKMYLWRKGISNASLYFLELTNETATQTTDISAFIEGSRITFFKFGSILI